MRITIVQERCSGCGNCAKVCPQKILRLDHEQVVVEDELRCMGCFGCEDECPKQAIRVLRAPLGQEPEIESTPAHADACDVAIIGAGPAGLGAAIGCARAGLETVVFERLPNRKLSHHTDGGVLFAFPGITSTKLSGDSLSFPELDNTSRTDQRRRNRTVLSYYAARELPDDAIWPSGPNRLDVHETNDPKRLAFRPASQDVQDHDGMKVLGNSVFMWQEKIS